MWPICGGYRIYNFQNSFSITFSIVILSPSPTHAKFSIQVLDKSKPYEGKGDELKLVESKVNDWSRSK